MANIKVLILFKKQLRLGDGKLYFSRYGRLYNYHKGVESRLSHVFYSYGLNENILIDIRDKLVVDVGANIGEFSVYLRKYCGHKGEIIAFEPDPHEFDTLSQNAALYNLKAINCAVSNVSGKIEFILNNEDADSRLNLIENDKFQNKISVQSVRLNGVLDELNVKEVGLVKIEAEGFEPEVLQGLDLSNSRVMYFAIDCGPERPPDNQSTLVDCLNYLLKNGYELINYNVLRHSILLKKL